ncbi:MAG: PQQ-dependent sugar dehydrogenase, partial [Clostridia bacterium]|nr:PQQ-dependent sugar dehydrogenase [Clostridia bacterium]
MPGPSEPPRPPEPNTVATGLDVPWALAFAPDGSLFVSERPGRIRLLAEGRSFVLAELPDTAAEGEGGLLGLALHPDFPATPLLYAYQTYRTERGLGNRI